MSEAAIPAASHAFLLGHLGGHDAATALVQAAVADPNAMGETLRRAAWAAFAASDDPAGESLLRRAARLPADAGQAWFAFGCVRLGRGDPIGARACFVAAARARNRAAGGALDGNAERLRRLPPRNRYAAFGLFYTDFEDAFTCFAVPQAATVDELQQYGFCFDRAMSVLGRTPAGDALLEAEQRVNGDCFWVHVNQGHRAWVSGSRDVADAHYAAAREQVLLHRLAPYHFNCGIIVWLARERAQALIETAPERGNPDWIWHLPAGDTTPAGALLVGFDPNYFVFLPKFLLSVARAYRASGVSFPFAVHCHIADAPPDQVTFVLDAAREIAARLPGLFVSISTGPSVAREPAHYTCLRYLALPSLMDRLGCGVVAMDVDSELVPDFFRQWEEISRHAFGLRMYSFNREGVQVGGEPWSIGAHPTYVSDTPLGRRFAGFLRDYINEVYDPALITNWTIDQCAIARGFDLLLRDQPHDTIFNFAYGEPLYRLPNEFGSKQAFLNHEPVTPNNFLFRLDAAD